MGSPTEEDLVAFVRGTGKPWVVHEYMRYMLALLEQHTPSSLIIQQPRHEGKQAMFKLIQKLKARKKRAPTCAERHAKRYPAMKLHPAITPELATHWMPKLCSSWEAKRSWNLMLTDYPNLSSLVVAV